MTVTYTSQVATCKGFGCFWKLLFRWKGSIYKLVWMELILYTAIYYLCSLLYRFALNEPHKRVFEKIAIFCDQFSNLIPVSFVLGFYVSIVVKRWWEQYLSLPWPDSLALFTSTAIHGQDQRSRLMRRTVLRYVNLSQTITLSMISPRVKKRFPTLDHLVEAGFMTLNELKIFNDLNELTPHPKYWMPLVWAGTVVTRARKEGRIKDDFAVKTIIDEINRIRSLCGGLLGYDSISIPLVYTQVVTLAVYSFFLATLMGRQFLDPAQNIPSHNVDFYVPIFTILQLFFFMGWLKVAETLVNPFGEDDDDFELNWLVDRNLQVSYLIVDEMHNEHPELIQDIYWDEVFPQELPYTVASEQFRTEPPQGSTADVEVPESKQEFLPMVEEEDEGIEEGTPPDHNHDPEIGSNKANVDVGRTGNSARASARSNKSGESRVGSARPLSSRKPSVLSMLLNRISGSKENVRRPGIRPNASTTSFLRRQRLMRSGSRMSTATHTTLHSPESMARAPTFLTQDNGVFRMSNESLNTALDEEISQNQGDDDGPIVIKIKRRDKDGNVIVMESCLDPPTPNKRSRSVATETGEDFVSDSDEKRLISPDDSINLPGTPSVFMNEADEAKEDNADHPPKKKKSLGNLTLRGLTKIFTSDKHHGGSRSTSPQQKRNHESVGDEILQEIHDLPSRSHVSSPMGLTPVDIGTSSTHNPEIATDGAFPTTVPESAAQEQQALNKPLETINEGPQEGNTGGDSKNSEEARKKTIPEGELEVIPEKDDAETETDNET